MCIILQHCKCKDIHHLYLCWWSLSAAHKASWKDLFCKYCLHWNSKAGHTWITIRPVQQELRNFDPCMVREAVQKLIYRLTSEQQPCQIFPTQPVPAQAIACNANLCILTPGKSPHCQNMIAHWGGFLHPRWVCGSGNQVSSDLSMGCLRLGLHLWLGVVKTSSWATFLLPPNRHLFKRY